MKIIFEPKVDFLFYYDSDNGTQTVLETKKEGKNVTFKDTLLELKVGESVDLKTITESPDNEEIGYRSDDTKVAKVDEQGIVTGCAPGSTVVTAALTSDSSITCTISITVTENTDTDDNKSAVSSAKNDSDTESDVSDTEKKDTSSSGSSSTQ